MSKASKGAALIDGALVLRDLTDGAEVATGAASGVALPTIGAAFWHGTNKGPDGILVVDIVVTGVTTGGGETYLIEIWSDDTADKSDSPVVVASLPITAVGVYRAVIDLATIREIDPELSSGQRYIGVSWTIGGSGSPALTFGATIAHTL